VHATNGQRGKASMHAAGEKRLEFIKIDNERFLERVG